MKKPFTPFSVVLPNTNVIAKVVAKGRHPDIWHVTQGTAGYITYFFTDDLEIPRKNFARKYA